MPIKKQNYLVCKRVRFYTPDDETAFFEWIQRIKSIKSFEGSGDELYLDLKKKTLTESDLYDFLGLFKRYKIDMKQLRPFLTDKNKSFLEKQKKAYWFKPLFGDDTEKNN